MSCAPVAALAFEAVQLAQQDLMRRQPGPADDLQRPTARNRLLDTQADFNVKQSIDRTVTLTAPPAGSKGAFLPSPDGDAHD